MTRLGWTFLAVLVISLIGFASMVRLGPAGPVDTTVADPPPTASPEIESVEDAPSGLVIPVEGVRADRLVESFGDSRGGGERRHGALDIPAPQGTPVRAAAAGAIEKLFFSQAGGNTVYIRSPDTRWVQYYAHLDSYAPGLAEGMRVKRGQPIGTVGSSGNASPDAPHLHFEVKRMAPGDAWYQGNAVDPYRLLTAETTDWNSVR